MENFKGTKGKWWVSGRDLMGEIHIKIAKFDPTDIKYQEHKYNLLLTSKAPEMLEMLQKIVKDFESDYVLDGVIVDSPYQWLQYRYKEAKKLIQESTEL
jgi:hypothetical protein